LPKQASNAATLWQKRRLRPDNPSQSNIQGEHSSVKFGVGEVGEYVVPKGDIHLLHGLPGRIRVRVEALKHNEALGEDFMRQLSALHGIVAVETNSATGSLLINYDPEVVEVLAFSPRLADALGMKAEGRAEGGDKASQAIQERIAGLEEQLRQAHAHISILEKKQQDPAPVVKPEGDTP